MFWKKRNTLESVPTKTLKVAEDLEKAFGVTRYFTDTGGYKGTARLQHTPIFSVRLPDEDTIHVAECRKSAYGIHHFVDGYTMAAYSFITEATYLYAKESMQLYIIKDGTVTFQSEYKYIFSKEDFFQYVKGDEKTIK